MNRRVAAARGLFEYAVMCGLVDQNPVPAPRRSSGLRARRSGLLGHVGWPANAGAGSAGSPGPPVARDRRRRRHRGVPRRSEHPSRPGDHVGDAAGRAPCRARSAVCGSPMSTWAMRQVTVVGKGNKTTGRADRPAVLHRGSLPISTGNDHTGWRRRSASWCCAARRRARR